MVNDKFESRERELRYREIEMRKKLFELFDRLDKLPITLQEKFDIFRSYFRGTQDGFFICLHSLNIESIIDQRPPIEMRIDTIINNVETGSMNIMSAWYKIDESIEGEMSVQKMTIKELTKMLLPDEVNAIIRSENLKRPVPKHGEIYYVDTSGIVRITEYKGKFILVDGFDSPSRIKGVSIKQLWNKIAEKNEYLQKL